MKGIGEVDWNGKFKTDHEGKGFGWTESDWYEERVSQIHGKLCRNLRVTRGEYRRK